MTARFIKTAFLISAFGAFNSCTSLKQNDSRQIDKSKYCELTVRYDYDSTFLPQANIQAIVQNNTALTNRYSQHDLVLANAIGILPLLKEILLLEASPAVGNQIENSLIRQKILSRLLVASTQIASVEAELDCEGERADRLAKYLDQRDAGRIRRLTVFSIVTGAVTTVTTTLLASGNVTKGVGVGGGVLGAGLGGWAAFSSNRTILLNHRRNLLADIWFQPEQSSIYPPFVWYVLNDKLFSYSGQQSISYNTRRRWQEYVLTDSPSETQQLYFGEGGGYKADDLHARAEMLNQLQSSVRSIYQDLYSLVLSFSK